VSRPPPSVARRAWHLFRGLVGKRGLDAGVALRERLANVCVALHFGRAPHAQGRKVAVLVIDVLDGVRHHRDAHVAQIPRRDVEHRLGKLLAVLVDLLHRHGTHNGALVPFQRHHRDVPDLRFGLAQKLLARNVQRLVVARVDLHLRAHIAGVGFRARPRPLHPAAPGRCP